MTNKFKISAAQGDVMLRRVKEIPATAKKMDAPEGPELIITHSETGHHHVCEADRVDMYCDAENPLIAWIKVNRPATLLHKRSFHTHQPVLLAKGTYQIRRQREYVAKGFRKVQD